MGEKQEGERLREEQQQQQCRWIRNTAECLDPLLFTASMTPASPSFFPVTLAPLFFPLPLLLVIFFPCLSFPVSLVVRRLASCPCRGATSFTFRIHTQYTRLSISIHQFPIPFPLFSFLLFYFPLAHSHDFCSLSNPDTR